MRPYFRTRQLSSWPLHGAACQERTPETFVLEEAAFALEKADFSPIPDSLSPLRVGTDESSGAAIRPLTGSGFQFLPIPRGSAAAAPPGVVGCTAKALGAPSRSDGG